MHEDMNERMIERSRIIADLIDRDTSMIARALDHVNILLQKEPTAATADIAEWKEILESYSVPRLLRFIVSREERANRLRQSSPFFAVLNDDERQLIMNKEGNKQ